MTAELRESSDPVAAGPEESGVTLVARVLRERWLVLIFSTLILSAGLVLRGAPALLWPALAYAVAACTVLAAVDLRYRRLPDVLTIGSYPTTLAFLLLPVVADGRMDGWMRSGEACVVTLIVVRIVGRAVGYGAGDAKLAGLVAIPLGWHSWGVCLLGIWCGFAVTGVVALGLLIARKATWGDRFAAGPSLMIGAYAVLLAVS
jgi:leader peptidase (prepilin peptidase)/N-methyltransferase